jgi:hypothetical protein
MALLEHGLKNSGTIYTVASHSRSHNVVVQTARTDLHALERQSLLVRTTSGRGHAWSPASDLGRRLGVS